jgi:2,4-dienoyl-CoA reductase (NADPH2)
MIGSAPHPPAVAATLASWHRMVASKDLSELLALLHADATFRSPMAFKPYAGASAVNLIVTTVIGVFEDFEYQRELATDDGLNAVLEFSARVGDKQLKGIDLIRFDADGRIIDFEVMIRPLSGLQALGDEMGRRIGPLLAAFKTPS